VQLSAAFDLSEFSRWTRNDYQNFMTMFAKTVAERSSPGQRLDVEEQGHTFHCYARSEGVAGIIISKDYPKLAAHQILSKVVDDFLAEKPAAEIARASKDGDIQFPALSKYLQTYQDPGEVNSIANIQKELDETKIVLHKTIESVLQRGEKLDDLVAKSSDLSAQSKMFYTTAKKQNSCCILM
jgi:synaptobrevin family protein YKT6